MEGEGKGQRPYYEGFEGEIKADHPVFTTFSDFSTSQEATFHPCSNTPLVSVLLKHDQRRSVNEQK